MQEIPALVSVIIPTHNRSDYLKKAIDSLLQQSYQKLEIIIIANNCCDNTADTINQIKRNTTVPILHLEIVAKIGGAKAYNIGIDHASGEYIAFLDDDDILFPHAIANHVKQLAQGKHSITSSICIYIHGDQGTPYKREKISVPKTYTLQDLYYENNLRGFSFCATKKKYLNGNRINEKLPALKDWDLWLKIIKNTGLPAYKDQQQHSLYLRRIGHRRISTHSLTILQAQKDFLASWQAQLSASAINYHKMRIECLTIQTQGIWNNKKRYLLLLSTIIKSVAASSTERYNIKRYLHYILLPFFDTRLIKTRTIKTEKIKT